MCFDRIEFRPSVHAAVSIISESVGLSCYKILYVDFDVCSIEKQIESYYKRFDIFSAFFGTGKIILNSKQVS